MNAYDQAVEVMARAAYACEGGVAGRGHRDWSRAGERNQDIWRAEAAAALDALVAAPRLIDCPQPLCLNGVIVHPDSTDEPIPMGPCPECSGSGSVPSADPLVILGPVQIVLEDDVAVSDVTGDLAWCNPNGMWQPVYREGTPDES